MYTIAPANNLQQVKHVHRSMLKARLCPEPLSSPPGGSLPTPAVVEGDSVSDDDLCVWVSTTPPCTVSVNPGEPLASSVQNINVGRGPAGENLVTVPRLDPALGVTSSLPVVSSSGEQPCSSLPALRRTKRTTAGQHANVHHLPRSVGPLSTGSNNLVRVVSSEKFVPFRPWN